MRSLVTKILLLGIARFVVLRFIIEKTFYLFPVSNYIAYSRLDDVYRDDLPHSLWGWGNFDGNHYIGIAMRGYNGFEHPFFPLYPALIGFFANLGVEPLLGAVLISFIAKLLAMIIITKLLKIDGHEKLTWLCVFVIMFFPTAFFYSAAYNDSLFFLLATLTIYLARTKRWVLAAVVAAVSTLTRLNGLILGLFLAIEYLMVNKKITPKFFVFALIPLAFLGYMAYLQISFGSWQLLFTDMSVWGQDKVIFPLQVFWRYFKILVLYADFTSAYFTAVLEMVFVLGYIALLVINFGKIRFSYWMLFAVSILVPALTGTFQGMPRYGLHLYPFFLMLTIFLHRQNNLVKILYFAVMTIVLFLLATMFVHGYFIA